MHPHLLHNGSIRRTDDLLLSPGQVGFMNGWGIFSTLRVAEGVLFAYERHYARMARDAQRIRVPFDYSPEELKELLLRLVEANDAANSTLRVAVVRNRGGLFEAPGLTRPSDLIAFTAPLNNWGSGVNLGYRPHARYSASPFAGTKYTAWAENLTMYESAHEEGFDEYILLNEHGQVSECTSANIFAIEGNQVWTPPLATSGCLPGITRALLLEEIRVPGFSVVERELTPTEIEACDGVFITSSTRDVLAVSQIGGEPVAQSTRVVEQFSRAFLDYRKSYVADVREASGLAVA